jgi:aldehyde dehydrogenase (NAD+)
MNAPFKHLIAGEWTGGRNASRNNAVAAAKAAFPAWSRTTPHMASTTVAALRDEAQPQRAKAGHREFWAKNPLS